jgi:hypothetical protein
MNVELKIDEIAVPMGIDVLSRILYNIPDSENNKTYQEFYAKLATHKSASIRKEVANKNFLSEDTVKKLLRDSDCGVLENIVRSDSTKKYFDEEDFEYILSTNSEIVIENVIGNLNDFECIENVDACYNKILDLENNYLTLKIAENYSSPNRILKKLCKHEDIDIKLAAEYSIS